MANDILQNYINSVSSKYAHEETSEMGYRTDFEILLKGIFESINVTRFDHDARAKQGNKPDFVVHKHDVPIFYIETKDIGVSLDKIEKSEQMSRYFGYANLVLTDYVEFRFYRNGLPYGEPIKIAEYSKSNRTISVLPNNFEYLAKTLVDFTQSHKEPIKSGKHLAKVMGSKAQRIRDKVKDVFESETNRSEELTNVYETLKRLLIHDLTVKSFADMYAQTLVYGLFVARFHDKTPENFSRQEARDLIPASNPFLGSFFDHIAGRNFEKRLSYIVDELCMVFRHADVAELMQRHFQTVTKKGIQRSQDQVVHFYEDFLKEYDDELRKKMGAYYTPLPVVQFIVRSVDYLLEKEFNLADGLASTRKTEDNVHKVQILDPAVGTGTFISDVIGKIYKRVIKGGQDGRWPGYVHYNLLPRLHGFELMMAPYTIAHLKLSIALKETGFQTFYETRKGKARLGIYLTNSLEEVQKQQELLAFDFGASIAEEAKQASKIKNEKPIMVVVGNPPYSGESSNAHYSGHDVYKVEPSGGKLQERNSKWINDDYVKFIRLAESMVEKTGEGIVAMITAHGYIDNPTFRGMRWHLMKTFDEIYVLDMHGNTNKKEKSPDGTEDKNVFDIKTGVAIFFGVKKKEAKTDLATIYQADLYGKRAAKFKYLNENLINSVKWMKLSPSEPGYEWVKRDEKLLAEYNKGFSVNELFPVSSVGVVTSRDSFVIDTNKKVLADRIQEFLRCQTPQEAKTKFNLKVNQKWKIANALKHEFDENNIVPISYRPFDTRFVYYHDDFIERSRKEVMRHLINSDNPALLIKRQGKLDFSYVFIAKGVTESCMFESAYANNTVCPLYLLQDDTTRVPNLNQTILNHLHDIVGQVSPEEILDYIYAVLHSLVYRKKYQKFIKADFPKTPYPTSKQSFEMLAKLGQELRQLHLLESSKVNNFITTYPETGSDLVDKPVYKDGNVYINDAQYFGNVPEVAWEFWIGGYQPAQKWLKDRKGTTLTNSEIEHYQKMIVALTETDNVMKEIDLVLNLLNKSFGI